jgi:gamma-butyrobetaine dioxygenase
MSTQVTFAYQNDGKHYSYTRPTIQPTTSAHTLLTDLDLGYNLFYSPPFQTRVNTINDGKFYEAIAKFEEILGRPGMMLRKRMEVGTCAVFLNRRVLHGRESFDEGSGERYLRGTYVGLDCYHDKIRMHLMNKSVH